MCTAVSNTAVQRRNPGLLRIEARDKETTIA
jgi:hypothetical protein